MEDPGDQHDDHHDDQAATRVKAPQEAFQRLTISPLPPIAPDGGFSAGPIGSPPPLPPSTPEFFVCLRGPCRYYWEMVTEMPAGNPAGTFGKDGLRDELGNPVPEPRQITRTCTAHTGTETDLTDDNVYACNLWDPLEQGELKKIRKRHEAYFREHPGHRR